MTKQAVQWFTAAAHPWRQAVLNLLWPEFCRVCGVHLLTAENGYFCPACWERSPAIRRPYCTHCGRPHPEMRGLGALENYPCADCRKQPPPHIGRIRGAARYEGAVADAVKLLKFHGKVRLAGALAARMGEFAATEVDVETYDALVPVPLHRVRQRARGFNQSSLIARELLESFPNAVLDERLQRIRPTRTQSRLSPEQRRSNVRGAFAVAGEGFEGKRVLLVDDVVTTAGTVSECARVLMLAGAVQVDVFAAAISVPRILA
jgi:ComF family protein